MTTAITKESKNVVTLRLLIKPGDPRILDVEDLTFEDVMFEDGTVVKNVRFDQLVTTILTHENKNNISITHEAKA